MNPISRFSRVAFCGLVLLFFGLMVSTGCKKKEPPPPPPPPTPTPVIPPGSVVFVQRGHLARLDLETSQITPLTGGKSTEWFPACSPTDPQIVYWSNTEDGRYELWKINLDGTHRTRMTFNETDALRTEDQNLLMNNAPAWSSDGKRILYSLRGDLWVMDADGFNPETVLLNHSARCPLFSPDGKYVVFISNAEDTVYNLWSLTLSDKSLKKLTQYTDWNLGSPAFSGDGRKILFNLYRSNTTQLYTVNADGTGPVDITKNSKSLSPRYAIMDRKILYCTYGTNEDAGLNVFMMNVNGTEPVALTKEGGTSPSWAPGKVAKATAPLPTPVGK